MPRGRSSRGRQPLVILAGARHSPDGKSPARCHTQPLPFRMEPEEPDAAASFGREATQDELDESDPRARPSGARANGGASWMTAEEFVARTPARRRR
jgi:hypothetical protein